MLLVLLTTGAMNLPCANISKGIFYHTLIKNVRNLKLPAEQPAVLILDNFNGQYTTELFKFLDSKSINMILIPANCTDRLQPLDISVNKAAKEFLRKQFH